MSESIHDTDLSPTDVAIAAKSHLDRDEPGMPDTPDESVTLIMGALEKMASATDQLARQMNERLEEVQRGILEDLDEARQDDSESSPLDELREHLDASIEAMRSALTEQQEELAEELRRTRDEDRAAREQQASDRKDDLEFLGTELASLREEMSRIREENSSMNEEALREAAGDRQDREQTVLQGQRTMVADLAEGIALIQTSMEQRLSDLDRDWKAELERNQQQWENFTTAQEERLDAMALQAREVRELGEKLDEEHNEMVRVFEQEKTRAEDAEVQRQHEQARRINNSGVARYHAGDFDQARRLFEQAVEQDQRFAEAFNNLGLALTELGEHEDATVAFETAIEINPDLGAGYNNLGYVLYLQENFEAAIEMYREAIGREHDTSAAYTNLGNAQQKLGATEKAVESWQRAVEIDPANERAQRYLERFAGPASI